MSGTIKAKKFVEHLALRLSRGQDLRVTLLCGGGRFGLVLIRETRASVKRRSASGEER